MLEIGRLVQLDNCESSRVEYRNAIMFCTSATVPSHAHNKLENLSHMTKEPLPKSSINNTINPLHKVTMNTVTMLTVL